MLATQKHITLRALSVILAVSLCCMPLFGCDGVDPVELPPEDDAVVDDTDPGYSWIYQINLPSENAVFMYGYPYEPEFAGIRIVINDATSQGVLFCLEDDFDISVSYTNYFFLLCLDGEEWLNIPFEENVGFDATLMIPHSPPHPDEYVSFTWCFDDLKPGRYRFVRGIYLYEEIGIEYRYYNSGLSLIYLYAEFEIE